MRLLIFLPTILISACYSSSLAFCVMCSAYKLNKQHGTIQPWCIPSPIWNQSVVPCLVLTAASCPAYRFLGGQVRWSGVPISWIILHFVVIHKVQSISIVNKAEVDVFFWNSLAFSMTQQMLAIWSLVPLPFLNPACTSGNSRFTSCWSLAWWMSSVTLLAHAVCLVAQLCLTLCVWDECNCAVVWAFFGIAFFGDWNENWPFPVLWPLWVFQICWHTECSTLTASCFRVWNSSAGIPSPPLALCLRPTWLHTPGCLALGGDYTIMVIWIIKIFFV